MTKWAPVGISRLTPEQETFLETITSGPAPMNVVDVQQPTPLIERVVLARVPEGPLVAIVAPVRATARVVVSAAWIQEAHDAYERRALERGRPEYECDCTDCPCPLHVWVAGASCIWCKNGQHNPRPLGARSIAP